VHPDDNLIVSHIALVVEDKMAELRTRLSKMGVKSRKNVSVPNPETEGTPVDQVRANQLNS
jgi:flagellar hook-length control protein FliK